MNKETFKNGFYRKLNTSNAWVDGQELSIEDRTTGQIYVTDKKYMDKLFNEMGYKNLNVIKIIDEYAGKVVSDIGTLTNSNLYVCDSGSSCIVASEMAVNWMTDLFSAFEKKGYEMIEQLCSDNLLLTDQYKVKSPTGTIFLLYPDLAKEEMTVVSTAYDESGKIIGLVNEGKYDMKDPVSYADIFALMDNPVDISILFRKEQELSQREMLDLFISLGYIKKKKSSFILTPFGEEYQEIDDTFNFEHFLDQVNEMSWLQRCINSSGYTFDDLCDFYNKSTIRLRLIDYIKPFDTNAKEQNDLSVLNQTII